MTTQVDDGPWHAVEDVDVASTAFPARARLAGVEGNDGALVVFRTPTGFRGTQRGCPHLQAPMSKAFVTGDGRMVRCPLHAFTFHLSNGKGVNCPGFRIKVYDIVERGGRLFGRGLPLISSSTSQPDTTRHDQTTHHPSADEGACRTGLPCKPER